VIDVFPECTALVLMDIAFCGSDGAESGLGGPTGSEVGTDNKFSFLRFPLIISVGSEVGGRFLL